MMEYKVYKWSDVLTIINGRNQNAVECEDGEYPIYGSGGVMGKANDYLCPPNCTIIGRKGNINKPIYVETKFWNVDTAFGLSANEEILNPRYLYYFCVDYNFERHNKAVTIPSLTKADLLKIEMCLPPLDKQKSIVGELDKINELIRLKKEQLKDYDNLAQSIFYEMFGDPVVNEKGWGIKKLGDVCEVSSFKRVLVEDVLEKGPVPFIRGTELSAICKENKREYKMYITMEHYERVKNISGVPNVGDLLIPSINAEGLVWVVDTPEPMYYKDGRVLWVHVDQNSISPIALQRILNNLIKDNYSKITNGAVFAELNLSILRSFPIILPPLSIQNAFANKINLIEKQKAEIQSTIADLETLLASRMQYWFD